MDKPVAGIARLRGGHWNARAFDPVGNAGGLDESVDGLTNGLAVNVEAMYADIGDAVQWTGEQADLAGQRAAAAEQARDAVQDVEAAASAIRDDVALLQGQTAADRQAAQDAAGQAQGAAEAALAGKADADLGNVPSAAFAAAAQAAGVGGSNGGGSVLLRPAGASGALVTYVAQSNGVVLEAGMFDAAVNRCMQAWFRWPGGPSAAITCELSWLAAASAGGVTWGAAAVAMGDGDATNAALGASVFWTDTTAAPGVFQITQASGAITVGGNPAAGDWVVVQIWREVAAGEDTLADSALLVRGSVSLPDGSSVALEVAGREKDTLQPPRYMEVVALGPSHAAAQNGGYVISVWEARAYQNLDGSGPDILTGATATASQEGVGSGAALMIDGNAATRFSTGPASVAQSFRFDLGAGNTRVPRRIEFESADAWNIGQQAFPQTAKVRFSMDAQNWTDAITFSTANTSSTQAFTMPLVML